VGRLGAVHVACMAETGHDVLGVDIDEGKTAMLNSGKAWFHEPGLDQMLARNVEAGRLRLTTRLAEKTLSRWRRPRQQRGSLRAKPRSTDQ
jgi:UDPglucose 6-dehydrogenase